MTSAVDETPGEQVVGRTLSRWTLAALTVGTMVGGGVFSLPGEFARSTGVVGSAIAWMLAGAGMFTLAIVFQRLSERRPDLDAGVYAYARAGFGRYAGFLSMIGYWAVAVLGNVVYWTLVMSTIGEWVPALRGGNTVAAVAASSAGLWFFHSLIARGVHQATAVNRVVTVAKLVPLLVFVVIVGSAFDPAVFAANLFSDLDGGSIPAQLSGTIAVTVFVFIGVEGVNTYSRFARRRRDVGWATITGFLSVLVLFVLVAMVGYGTGHGMLLQRAEGWGDRRRVLPTGVGRQRLSGGQPIDACDEAIRDLHDLARTHRERTRRRRAFRNLSTCQPPPGRPGRTTRRARVPSQ